MRKLLLFVFCCISWPISFIQSEAPTVFVSLLVRNKEHTLPYMLGALDRLDYPKKSIGLWIVLDHTVDKSKMIIDAWLPQARSTYGQVQFSATAEPKAYKNQISDVDWPEERMDHVVALKQTALSMAKNLKADYLFFLDADVVLLNPRTLNILVSLEKPVVAPMLNSTGMYSNFWGGMAENGYYQRSENYPLIRSWIVRGAFQVPMVHSAVLIDLRFPETDKLSFEPRPHYPNDDIISFAVSAKENSVEMFVINTEFFGFMLVPRDAEQSLDDEIYHWRELVTSKHAVADINTLPEPFSFDIPETTKLGFDEIYVINLLRRPDRFITMQRILRIFNIDYRHFPAVDGHELNSTYLSSLQVKMLEGYLDPYLKRPLKMGEIGCFLSHYFIWKDMLEKGYKRILILEDDALFVPSFNTDFKSAEKEADFFVPNWDLMYVGRKAKDWENEVFVRGASNVLYPSYSYWTVGYALNAAGARKLLAQEPQSKMVAVDEYIPIMFDKNPNTEWYDAFPKRDLIALAVHPSVVYPSFYTFEEGYYSDTEDSVTISPESTLKPPRVPNEVFESHQLGDHGEL